MSVFGWCNDNFHAACRGQYDTHKDGQPVTRTCDCRCHYQAEASPNPTRTKKGW